MVIYTAHFSATKAFSLPLTKDGFIMSNRRVREPFQNVLQWVFFVFEVKRICFHLSHLAWVTSNVWKRKSFWDLEVLERVIILFDIPQDTALNGQFLSDRSHAGVMTDTAFAVHWSLSADKHGCLNFMGIISVGCLVWIILAVSSGKFQKMKRKMESKPGSYFLSITFSF